MGKKSKTKVKKGKHIESIIKPLITELFQKCVNPTDSKTPSPRQLFDGYKEIHEMLTNLEKHRETSVISQLRDREECIEEFHHWARENGVVFENVAVKSVGNSELGVFATDNFKEGDIFVKIPKEAMLTSDLVTASPIGPLIANDPMLSSMPNVALALLLLHELYSGDSKWQPYINVLPRRFSNILYFSIDQIELLKGTSMFLEALNVVRSIARQYAYLSNMFLKHPLGKELGFADKLNYEDYKWAVATLMTRQNPIPSTTGQNQAVLALIPFLDMCNHVEGPVSIDYNPETKECECFAANPVKPRDEIKIYYGPRPNTELVVYNGFFYAENSHDYIKLKLGLSKSDPCFATRKELTTKLGLEEFFPLARLPTPIKDSLAAFIVIAQASKEELEKMQKLKVTELAGQLNGGELVGKETKIKCLQFLKDRCMLFMKLVPGTIEGDTKKLEERYDEEKEEEMPHTEVLSIMLRRNEKKLLMDMITYAEKELASLFE